MPFEQLSNDLHKTLTSLDGTLRNAEQLVKNLNQDVAPEITAAMKDVRSTLATANKALARPTARCPTTHRCNKTCARPCGR